MLQNHPLDFLMSPESKGTHSGLVVASVTEDGFSIPLAAVKARKPKVATVLDEDGVVVVDRLIPVILGEALVIRAAAEARHLAVRIVIACADGSELLALVHHTLAIREMARSGKQAQLRASLVGLSSGTGDLAKVIAAVEKVIFDEPDLEVTREPGKVGRVSGGSKVTASERPESLAASMHDDRKRRAHRRILESGDLAYLLDVLIRRLGIGLERPEPEHDEKGRSEEEVIGADDVIEKEQADTVLDDAKLAKLCRAKVHHLVGRMIRQMEQAARRTEKSPTVLIQLVAVLATIRELRIIERAPKWAGIRERLVTGGDEDDLLDGVLTYLFGTGYQLYQAITVTLGDDRFDELARLKGLLIWLAWDCDLRLDDRFGMAEEPEDVEVRLCSKAALLEFAQMLKGDDMARDEASNSVLQTANGSTAIAASRWIGKYFGWADTIPSTSASVVDDRPGKAGTIAVGDIAVVTTEKQRKLRVVSSITAHQIGLIDFGRDNGEIQFVRERVVRVAS